MKTTFYQRGDMIHARIYDSGHMIRVSTGVRVGSNQAFMNGRESFVVDTADDIESNNNLNAFRTKVSEAFLRYKDLRLVKSSIRGGKVDADIDLIVDLMKRYVEKMKDGSLKSKKRKAFTESTIRVYDWAAYLYEEFSRESGSLTVDSINMSGLEYAAKREVVHKLHRHIEEYVSWMEDRDYSINTRSDMVNVLSVMLRYWEDEMLIEIPKIPKYVKYEPPIVVLDKDFVSFFISGEGYRMVPPELVPIWEVCAIMLATTLRISDAISLKAYNLYTVDDSVSIRKHNIKTGVETMSPLPPMLSWVIRGNIINHASVFSAPIPSAGYVRDRIQKLMSLYPQLDYEYSYTRKSASGTNVVVTDKMYNLVHPHMLRKTAITSMLAHGVSPDHVRFASGHSENSRSFSRYVGFVNSTYMNEISGYNNKMFTNGKGQSEELGVG